MDENKETQETQENGATPTTEGTTTPVAKETFKLDDGSEGSRSAYIRQEFKKDRSRNDIAKELKVAYYIVYAATANMFNAEHPEDGNTSGGRGTMVEDEESTTEPKAMISRADAMRRDLDKGMTRGAIAKKYDVAYATVYAATKSETSSGEHGGKITIELEDGSKVGRADYIRQLFAGGKTRREIANELKCDYAIVWAATKVKKDKKDDAAAEGATPPEDMEDPEQDDNEDNEDTEDNTEE